MIRHSLEECTRIISQLNPFYSKLDVHELRDRLLSMKDDLWKYKTLMWIERLGDEDKIGMSMHIDSLICLTDEYLMIIRKYLR